MVIKKFETVSSSSQYSFDTSLERVINTMQRHGYEVEIQFSTACRDNALNDHVFSALVIGRG